MKKIFFFVFGFLLSVTVMRLLIDEYSEPLTFSSFLEILSTVDIDFSITVSKIGSIFSSANASFGNGFLDTVLSILQYIGGALFSVFTIIADIGSFIVSVFDFFVMLLGGSGLRV